MKSKQLLIFFHNINIYKKTACRYLGTSTSGFDEYLLRTYPKKTVICIQDFGSSFSRQHSFPYRQVVLVG